MRSKVEYLNSLRDSREVYFEGKRVDDVTNHHYLKKVAEHLSTEFEIGEDPAYRDLVTFESADSKERYGRYFKIPRNTEDLLARNQLIDLGTRIADTVVLLIKEIGTDCLFALNLISKVMDQQTGSSYYQRVKKFHEYCMHNDLAMAVAQTDVKGDRSLGPSDQEHPDYYLRVIDERSDGIVVRGAKAHTTYAPLCNEILVIPTRALSEKDKDYALAFATPANSKGLKMIVSPFGGNSESEFQNPISANRHMTESLTVFDDVFVPWDRVFLHGESEYAGQLALRFVDFHRFTAISYKAPLLDLIVGTAILVADYNGISRASHVRDKIARLIGYAETVKTLTRAAANSCDIVDGIAIPNTMITNTAKFHFAENYHTSLSYLQDIAGGLVVTGPHEDDIKNPETGKYIEKYLGGKKGTTALNRLKLMNLIRDLTASDFGGYYQLLQIHAEGSLEAEKLMIYRSYDWKPSVEYSKKIAHINEL